MKGYVMDKYRFYSEVLEGVRKVRKELATEASHCKK